MKRHTPKTLRQGCSVWYPRMDWRTGQFVVARIMVGSDNMPDPEPHLMYNVYPRSWLVSAMAERELWDHRTRRSAQRECDRMNHRQLVRKQIIKARDEACAELRTILHP